MRTAWRAAIGVALIGVGATAGVRDAKAQTGGPRSLGGYGGSMGAVDSGASMGGPVIPYGGAFGGFMPFRMGGGGSGGLSFQPRGNSAMGGPRTSFSLSPMSGGMSPASGGMGQGFGAGARPFSSFGFGGTGGGMPMPGASGRGVMPPNFGYPFRQPPSLLSPAPAGAGMSM